MQNIEYCAYFRSKDGLILGSSPTLLHPQGAAALHAVLSSSVVSAEAQLCIDVESDAVRGHMALHVQTGSQDGAAVLTPTTYPRGVAASFLSRLLSEIRKAVPEEAVAVAEDGTTLASVLQPIMEKECALYEDPSKADAVQRVMRKVSCSGVCASCPQQSVTHRVPLSRVPAAVAP